MPLAPFGSTPQSESSSNSSSSTWHQSSSGVKYTPQQQEQLDWLFPETKKRLSKVDPGKPFSEYLSSVGGTPVDIPDIPMIQAYSQDQINAKTNSYFSGADVRTGGEQRQVQQQAAGRGFGTNSPLIMELQQAAAGRNYRTAMESAREFDMQAAVENAQLEEAVWNLRLQGAGLESYDDIRRREEALKAMGYDVQRENHLLNSMNQLLTPLPFSQSSGGSSSSKTSSSYDMGARNSWA